MRELERELRGAARDVAYPPTPDLAAAVVARIAEDEARRTRRRRPSYRVIAAIVAAALLLAAAAAAAVPSARNAVLDFIGLRGAIVERVSTNPRAPISPPLHLGTPTSLRQARAKLAFRPLVPRRLGAPDGVFVRQDATGGEVALVYGPRPGLPSSRFTGVGLLVGEHRGDLEPDLIKKVVGPSGEVERVSVDGHRATWISGGPHEVLYLRPNGRVESDRVRLAQNVLLIEHGRVLVRIEGALSLREATRIARSLQ